jgi:tetratricopeptide (TPR) repeat protein
VQAVLETNSSSALTAAAAAFDRRDFARAERMCRSILAAAPDDISAQILLGRTLQAAGNIIEAQTAFRAAVKLNPREALGWVWWAKLLRTANEPAKARDCLRMALDHVPDSFLVHNDLALLLLAEEDVAGADRHLCRALEIEPNSAIGLCHLGLVRVRQDRIDEAIVLFRRGIAINPALPELHNNLGDILKRTDFDAAERSFLEALKLRPNYAEALDNLGGIAFLRGQYEEALTRFDQALAVNPNYLLAVGHKTVALFHQQRFAEAWVLYKERFRVEGYKRDPHGRFPHPVWSGQSFAGKNVLVWTELGLGEQVLQASMFPDILAVARKLTVECGPRLAKLFASSFPGATIIPRGDSSRPCTVPIEADFQIAAGDLGGAFRNARPQFPRHTGYLRADNVRVSELRRKYRAADGNFVVGIAWASKNAALGPDKTLALMDFAPILREQGITFVNLQYAADPAEIAAATSALGIGIVTDDSIDPLGDMDDIAAQVAAMDLVISVSNTTVHFAGALAVPVWNLVPGYNAASLWHWFSDTDESAWYPSMKIFRRKEKDSRGLMTQLAADLRKLRQAGGERVGS